MRQIPTRYPEKTLIIWQKKNYADNCLKSLSRMSVRHLESLCSIFCSQLIDVTRKKVNLGR